ncbi:MAG TPA: TolC family protein [Vicinamibacterales bacterium]|nr:TolC family protein [Vicinamibacterales bacterium]
MRRIWQLGRYVMSAACVVTVASSAAAQQTTEVRIEELIREAAIRAGLEPTTALAQAASPQGPVLRLTLDDAIKLALERNLDISVQRLNPQAFDFSLSSLRSTYRPTLTSNLSQQSVTRSSTSTISGATVGTGILDNTATFNAGLSQNVWWGGGNLSVAINNNRQTTTNSTALVNPNYQANWAANYTQPLLRNLRIDNTRQQIVVTQLNQDISEIQLQATIINTVSNVRNAYWDFAVSVQAVEVARSTVQLAEQLVRDNQTRVEVGTMAPIDVIQAQAQAATARQNLAVAEGLRRTNEVMLKRLIVNGTQDPNWSSSIDPIESPDFVPETVDVGAAVRRALDARTDLAQVRKNLEVNDVTLKYLKNQTLPQVDFNARYGLAGQGGTQFISTGSGISRVVTGEIPGGYGDALSTLFNRNYPTWTVGVSVAYPIGTSSQDASYARAQLQLTQVEAQIRQIELQVATDVTNAATQVQNNIERVQAARAARELAERQREAEQSKFEVGMSTNYFVVQSQRDLASAQNAELLAILAYRRAVVELERLQQTSTQSANITILGR